VQSQFMVSPNGQMPPTDSHWECSPVEELTCGRLISFGESCVFPDHVPAPIREDYEDKRASSAVCAQRLGGSRPFGRAFTPDAK
jgi:hypothetical protein